MHLIKEKQKLKNLLLYSIAIIILFLVVVYYLPENSYDRLFVESYDDGSNAKRLVDWHAGIKAFEINPLFGYGYNGEQTIIQTMTGVNLISHNTYIALLLQFGVVGCLIYLLGLFGIIRDMLKKREVIMIGGLVATFFVNFPISGEVSLFFWWPIIILACSMDYIKRRKGVEFKDIIA